MSGPADRRRDFDAMIEERTAPPAAGKMLIGRVVNLESMMERMLSIIEKLVPVVRAAQTDGERIKQLEARLDSALRRLTALEQRQSVNAVSTHWRRGW
jgi:hypothetical protein